MRPFRTTWTERAEGGHGVIWYAIAMILEGKSRVSGSGEGTQLSEGGRCLGDACQRVWWQPVNVGWTPGVGLLVRVTILIARQIRAITRVTRLIFRVTGLMIKATRMTRLMTRLMTRMTRCESYRVSKFLISPVHHISVWVAVKLGRRKGLSRIKESEKYRFFITGPPPKISK